jgi:peptidoglycan/LPS O-acetylase OafA/YrhL
MKRSPSEEIASVTAPTRFYIPSLDGVRAIAFAIVFVSHVRNNVGGMFGVTIFFFLSGYLITTLLRRENDLTGNISLSRFYARRVLRIMPPFYLTICFILLLVHFRGIVEPITAGMLAAYSCFLGNYWAIFRPANPALGPMWSLAVEEHFYLVFPLLFILLNKARIRYRSQAALLGGLAAVVLLWRVGVALNPSATTAEHLYLGTDTRIDSILFGCIMALACNPVVDRGLKPSRWLVGAGAVGLMASLLIHNTLYRQTIHYTVQGLALIPIFMALVTWGDTWFAWLNLPWVRYVGTLSYTLYLVHRGFIFLAWEHIGSHAAGALLALLGSFVFAILMNRLIERPLIQLRKRLAYSPDA